MAERKKQDTLDDWQPTQAHSYKGDNNYTANNDLFSFPSLKYVKQNVIVITQRTSIIYQQKATSKLTKHWQNQFMHLNGSWNLYIQTYFIGSSPRGFSESI